MQLIQVLGGLAVSCTERMLSLWAALHCMHCVASIALRPGCQDQADVVRCSAPLPALCRALLFIKQHAPCMVASACCAALIIGAEQHQRWSLASILPYWAWSVKCYW